MSYSPAAAAAAAAAAAGDERTPRGKRTLSLITHSVRPALPRCVRL